MSYSVNMFLMDLFLFLVRIVLQIPLVLETAKISPYHRVAEDGMDFCKTSGPRVQARPPTTSCPRPCLRWLSNISRHGESKASLGSLCPCLVSSHSVGVSSCSERAPCVTVCAHCLLSKLWRYMFLNVQDSFESGNIFLNYCRKLFVLICAGEYTPEI